MDTLKKLIIVVTLITIANAGCSPATADLEEPTVSDTQLPSSTPISTPYAAATNTPDPSRDLSIPSTIIVGHWRSTDAYPSEFYFGNFDENGYAPCFYNELFEQELRPSTCHIYEEREDTLWIKIITEDESHLYNIPFTPAKDGQTMLSDDEQFEYIDSNTEP